MSWIPWQSTFMTWLTADSMRIMIFGTLILCVVGCVLAALLGRWSRRSHIPRLLRATAIASLFSWTFFVGQGAVGVLPSVFVLAMTPKAFIGTVATNDDFLALGLALVSISVIFLSYWKFNSPKQ